MRIDRVRKEIPLSARVGFKAASVLGRIKVPDIAYVMTHRPELFGRPFSEWLEELLRGPSEWSIGDRELFASFTASRLQCEY